MKDQEVEILLVEGNPGDSELTIRALKKSHLANHVTHLVDGAEGLDFLFGLGQYSGRDLNIIPKGILLDLKMPKVDGLEVLRHLKSDPRTKMIPVVILTSSDDDPNIKRCYELGAKQLHCKACGIEQFYKNNF